MRLRDWNNSRRYREKSDGCTHDELMDDLDEEEQIDILIEQGRERFREEWFQYLEEWAE